MSDRGIVMKFELLPNELIIECFEYLDIYDIFYSFDRLDYRFYKLLRNIPLYLNFQHVRKSKFDHFCSYMLSNPEIQRQIYTLHLTNEDSRCQIETFLSLFSLGEFSHVRSLTLTRIETEDVAQLKSMLPLLSNLNSFHLICPQTDDSEIVSALPISNLRRLSVVALRSILAHTEQTTRITHLTICSCSLEQMLYQLFKNVPMLKYLNVECVSRYNRSMKNDTIIDKYNGVHLNQLIIGKFKYSIKDFGRLASKIPNLKSLTITADNDIHMFNALHWRFLITHLLRGLKIFKFKFSWKCRHSETIILRMLKQFQTVFWRLKHQWDTEISVDKNSIHIYTIPYLSHTFKIEPSTKRWYVKPVSMVNTFDTVTHLTLCYEMMTETCSYIFSNVISLTLFTSAQETNDLLVPTEVIACLKRIVKLSNIKYLDISLCQKVISSGELLEILKASSQLSSILIDPNDLILLYNDNELCKYLNKMIKIVNLYKHGHTSFNNLTELKKFCRIFSNIEQIKCCMNEPKYILFLLYRLSKLLTLHIDLTSIGTQEYFRSLLTKHAHKLQLTCHVKRTAVNDTEVSIWIDTNIN